MTAINDITGDSLVSKSNTEKFRSNYDKIFSGPTEVMVVPETVTVNKAYYEAIQKDSEFLEILDSQCVHLWSGYAEAVKISEEEQVQMDGEEYGYEG
jgi:hypothetical protein